MDRHNRLKLAFEAVKDNKMSIRAASKEFAVPKSTLNDRLSGRISLDIQRRTSLTEEEESKFTEWVIKMARTGFGRTKKDFLTNIQTYLNQLQEPTKRFKNNNKPGKTWYYDFLARHPELTERSAAALGYERVAVTPEKLIIWFRDFERYVVEEDATLLNEPARWFNADESGFALASKARKILAPKATRNDHHLYINTSSSKQQITTLHCMSAAGLFVPPMLVYPGKRLTVNPNIDFEVCATGLSESGWMTSELFAEWLENIFVKSLAGIKRPVILLVDGSSTHKSKKASDICVRNRIILYCLPPNATHLMQPLDLSFFGCIKRHWADAVSNYQLKNPGMCVTKSSFALVLKTAYEKACTAEVARSGFKQAGLFPLCKEAVLNTKKMMASNNLVRSPPMPVLDSQSSSPVLVPSASSPVSPVLAPSSSLRASHVLVPPSLPLPSVVPSPSPSLSTPVSSSSTSLSMLDKMKHLEAIMTEDMRVKYATRFEEGYDLQDDPFYNAWKEYKLHLSDSSHLSAPTVPPTTALTVPPTFSPTVPHAIAPAVPHAIAPAASPTFSPAVPHTTAPAVSRTLFPTVPTATAPAASPTFSPAVPHTTAPAMTRTLFPTVPTATAPAASPTFSPAVPHTTAPAVSRTLFPTVPTATAPAASPTFSPAVPHTTAPAVSRTLFPTVPTATAPAASPTFSPTVPHTTAPAMTRTLFPTVPTATAPAASPTFSPTVPHTTAPVVSPTPAPAVTSSLPDCLPSTSSCSPQDIDSFLSCPRMPERKRRVIKKVVPNMALTSQQTIAYFEGLEKEKKNEERMKEENKRKREEKKKQSDEEKKRKKMLVEEKKKKAEEKKKGKGKGKAAKRLRFESISEDEANVVLNDDSDVSMSEVNVNECCECHGLYKDVEASLWVGCNECDRWFHKKCVKSMDLCGVSEQQLRDIEFICDVCVDNS